MKRTLIALIMISSLLPTTAVAQAKRQPKVVFIKAGRLIDVRAGRALDNQGILVEGERIKMVGPLATVEKAVPSTAEVIDLSRSTVLPGLAIVTACTSQGDITAADTMSKY